MTLFNAQKVYQPHSNSTKYMSVHRQNTNVHTRDAPQNQTPNNPPPPFSSLLMMIVKSYKPKTLTHHSIEIL